MRRSARRAGRLSMACRLYGKSGPHHHLACMDATEPPLFETRIAANRSLSARGTRLVILLLTAASLLIGTLFWWLGAWPVPGFCGLEVLLACVLLRRNARDARAERIVLRPDLLLLSRVGPRGEASETRLSTSWLRVELSDRPAAPVRVRLVGHGVREEVGGLLGEAARRALARDLDAALRRCGSPWLGRAVKENIR